jgi:hypothetical protein
VSDSPARENFLSLIDLDKWQSFDSFLETSDARLLDDIKRGLEWRKRLREDLLSDPNFRTRVKTVSPELSEWAQSQLFSGGVCAVDGTMSVVPSISGGRARIGVVATSYKSDKIERVIYVSYRQLAEPVDSSTEYFKRLKGVNKTSTLMMRAVMAFAERDLALRRQEPWKFVHGELVPYELRTGAGRTKLVLPKCIDLGVRLIDSESTIGIIEGSEDTDLLNAAEMLERFEYIEARGLDHDLDEWLKGPPDPDNPGQRLRGAHFNPSDQKMFEKFVSNHAKHIKIGIFKVGFKPFLFQAHESNFDKAAALVMTDASMQPLRGFPLLLDYADHICSQHLAGKDFEKQIHFKTAQFGIEALGYEIDPRKTRRR